MTAPVSKNQREPDGWSDVSLAPPKSHVESDATYTPKVPVLDLRGQNITSTLDLKDAFHQLHLCSTEDETQGEWSTNGRRKYQKTRKSH